MFRAQDFDRESRPLFGSRRSAVRQFAGGALAAFAVTGVGYALAQVTDDDTPRPAVTRCADVECSR